MKFKSFFSPAEALFLNLTWSSHWRISVITKNLLHVHISDMIKFFSLLWINVFYSLPYDMTHVHQISADQSQAELARCHNYRSSALFIKLKFYAFWLFKIRGKWTVQIDGLSIICEHVFRSPSHQSSGSLHLVSVSLNSAVYGFPLTLSG